MMSVTITYFILAIFASFGLHYFKEIKIEGKPLLKHRKILITIAAFFGIGIILYLSGNFLSFTKSGGESYSDQYIELFRQIRKEFYFNDITRYFIFIFFTGAGVLAYLYKKLNFKLLASLLTALVVIDQVSIHFRFHNDYADLDKMEKSYFRKTVTDKFLESDTEVYRIMPLGRLFNNNRWGYYHETVGGYSPIKMYAIEELIQNCLYAGWDKNMPVNLNILRMLNVKYIISQGKIMHPQFIPENDGSGDQTFLYRFIDHKPRAYIVGRYEVIEDEFDRLKRMNNKEFNIGETAILEEQPAVNIKVPDSTNVKILKYSPNEIHFDIYSDKQSILVISEPYYPPGWKIELDNQRVDTIYKTNHALQSIIVPAGNHNVRLFFHPDSFYNNISIAYASLGMIYLTVIASLVTGYLKKHKPKTDAQSI